MTNETTLTTDGQHKDLITFEPDKLDLIKRTVAQDATNDELALFLHQCQRTGLDPLARQIYFMKYQGNVSIITGIDGYRLVADRTGKYAGNDDAVYEGRINLSGGKEAPAKATVTVWKIVQGERRPFSASAYWSEYYPGEGKRGYTWRNMPHVMLAKCAESLALRKAFPADLSGVYTREEMEQSNYDMSIIDGDVVQEAEADMDGKPLFNAVKTEKPKTNNGNQPPAHDVDLESDTPPNNLKDFAVWYANRHPYYQDNHHVVGTLIKKIYDSGFGVSFSSHDIDEVMSKLDDYAKQNAEQD